VALLRKMICDLRHPMGLRHPVFYVTSEYAMSLMFYVCSVTCNVIDIQRRWWCIFNISTLNIIYISWLYTNTYIYIYIYWIYTRNYFVYSTFGAAWLICAANRQDTWIHMVECNVTHRYSRSTHIRIYMDTRDVTHRCCK